MNSASEEEKPSFNLGRLFILIMMLLSISSDIELKSVSFCRAFIYHRAVMHCHIRRRDLTPQMLELTPFAKGSHVYHRRALIRC